MHRASVSQSAKLTEVRTVSVLWQLLWMSGCWEDGDGDGQHAGGLGEVERGRAFVPAKVCGLEDFVRCQWFDGSGVG